MCGMILFVKIIKYANTTIFIGSGNSKICAGTSWGIKIVVNFANKVTVEGCPCHKLSIRVLLNYLQQNRILKMNFHSESLFDLEPQIYRCLW